MQICVRAPYYKRSCDNHFISQKFLDCSNNALRISFRRQMALNQITAISNFDKIYPPPRYCAQIRYSRSCPSFPHSFPFLFFLRTLLLYEPWKICCPRLTVILLKVNYVLGSLYYRRAVVTYSLWKLICTAVNSTDDIPDPRRGGETRYLQARVAFPRPSKITQ